jgi:hypothetical protein
LTSASHLESLRGVSNDDRVQISLATAEIEMLTDGLDALEYWQLGDVLPRNDGVVFIPGDLTPGEDHYWDGVQPTADQQEAMEAVRASRELRDRLMELTRQRERRAESAGD